MNKNKWLGIGIGLVVICAGLVVSVYMANNKLVDEVKLLEQDLKDKSRGLEDAKIELLEANQKNILFVTEKESLNSKMALQKEQIAEIIRTKESLVKQQEALAAGKEDLEDALAEIKKLHQKQIKLYELKVESREKDFKKKADSKMVEFIIDKKALEEQVKNAEVKLEESIEKNKELLEKLDESSQTIVEFKIAGGKGSDQLDSVSLEDEKFRKQALKHHYNKALAYDQDLKYKKALIEYKKALEAAPNDADVHYNLAILYDEHLINKRKAIEHYQAYLEVRPDAKDAVRVEYWIVEARKVLDWESKTK